MRGDRGRGKGEKRGTDKPLREVRDGTAARALRPPCREPVQM